MFLQAGLDRPNQVDPVAEITISENSGAIFWTRFHFANRYAPPFSIERWNAGRACIRDNQAAKLG
jgi:hypothetical protein